MFEALDDLPATLGAPVLGDVPTERLEAEVVSRWSRIQAAECRWLLLVGELDRRSAAETWGCRSMAHWLSWQCGIDPSTGREKVRVARALADLPLVTQAFAEGRLTYSKVRAITRVATAATERSLVEIGEAGTASHVLAVTRGYARAGSADDDAAVDREQRQHEARGVHVRYEADGSVVLEARLTAEAGARVLAALDEGAEARREQQADDPRAARRADVLASWAEGPEGREGATLVVHADVQAVAGEGGGEGEGEGECRIEGGGPVSRATVLRLACHGEVQAVLRGPDGRCEVTPPRRLPNRATRRRLRARDGGRCRFPGCDSRHHLQAHHVWHWLHGGPTELWNLVTVCGFHHRFLHELGWRLELRGPSAEEVVAMRPDGSVLEPTPRPTRVASGWSPERIDSVPPDACVPGWGGERLDLGGAVAALCEQERRYTSRRCTLPSDARGSASTSSSDRGAA